MTNAEAAAPGRSPRHPAYDPSVADRRGRSSVSLQKLLRGGRLGATVAA